MKRKFNLVPRASPISKKKPGSEVDALIVLKTGKLELEASGM